MLARFALTLFSAIQHLTATVFSRICAIISLSPSTFSVLFAEIQSLEINFNFHPTLFQIVTKIRYLIPDNRPRMAQSLKWETPFEILYNACMSCLLPKSNVFEQHFSGLNSMYVVP